MTDPFALAGADPLTALLRLLPDGPSSWVTDRLDVNLNGRVFGGQLLAHAIVAATAQTPGRHLSSLRLGFLQGALAGEPVRWVCTPLQQGKRFTTCHLRASQGERVIADAQVTLQVPGHGFEHADAMPAGLPAPDDVPNMAALEERIAALTGARYDLMRGDFLELRLIDAERLLLQPADQPVLRYWVKAREPMGDDPVVHAAALGYLSDYWFNCASILPHIGIVGSRDQVYVASLNHALWCYAPCRADEWLLFDTLSPRAGDGRGLTWGRIFTRDGRLVACATQEMLCSPRDAKA